MEQPPLRSVTKEASSSLSIPEQQLAAMLVRTSVIDRPWLSQRSTVQASGTVKKVIEINPYLLGTMAGGAGMFLYSL